MRALGLVRVMLAAVAAVTIAPLARADEADASVPPEPPPPSAIVVRMIHPGADVPDVPPPPKKRYVQRGWSLSAGVRNTVVTSASFDPYSNSDLFAQGSVGVAYALFKPRLASVSLAGGWDGGVHEAKARGIPASVAVHRFSLGLVARRQIVSHLDGFVRVAGEAIHARGSLDDPRSDARLVVRSWTWGLDAMGGASILLGTAGGDPAWPAARFWIDLEAGYGFTGDTRMAYHPDVEDDDPRLYGNVELPALRLSGFTTRAALVLSF